MTKIIVFLYICPVSGSNFSNNRPKVNEPELAFDAPMRRGWAQFFITLSGVIELGA